MIFCCCSKKNNIYATKEFKWVNFREIKTKGRNNITFS
jgi:hypothetical protein